MLILWGKKYKLMMELVTNSAVQIEPWHLSEIEQNFAYALANVYVHCTLQCALQCLPASNALMPQKGGGGGGVEITERGANKKKLTEEGFESSSVVD